MQACQAQTIPQTLLVPSWAVVLGEMNVTAAAQKQRTTARGLMDAYQQEKKRAILKQRGWKKYQLPAALLVPDTTKERFGVDFTPAGDALAAAMHAQQTGKLTNPPSPEEEEEFYEGE